MKQTKRQRVQNHGDRGPSLGCSQEASTATRWEDARIEPWDHIQPRMVVEAGQTQPLNLLVNGIHLESQVRQIWFEKLVTGVLKDASFALVRLDRTYIHNFFNRTGGSVMTRNAGVEAQLEFLEERDKRGFLRGVQQTVRVYLYRLNG